MKLNEIETRLVAWYLTSIQDEGPSFLIQSAPGRGKTTTLKKVAQKLNERFPGKNFGVQIRNGASLTLTSITGYLMPGERDGVRYSEFTRPAWWITDEGKPLEAYDGGVFIIDELDKMFADEKKLAGEAALSKIFGTHRLPPGWVVWFAGNRAGDRSGSTKDLDHLITRRITVDVQDDVVSLREWMERNGCLPETITFVDDHSAKVFMPAPEKQGPYCTPRSLVQADSHLHSLMEAARTDMIPTDALTQEELAGGIGVVAAKALVDTIRMGQELPRYEDIIKTPKGTPVPKKPDALRLAAYKLASRVERKDIGAVLTYMGKTEDKRFPDEFQLIFGRMAVQRDYKLALDPAFAQWCAGHAQLIKLVQSLK